MKRLTEAAAVALLEKHGDSERSEALNEALHNAAVGYLNDHGRDGTAEDDADFNFVLTAEALIALANATAAIVTTNLKLLGPLYSGLLRAAVAKAETARKARETVQ